eukprot:RCo049682
MERPARRTGSQKRRAQAGKRRRALALDRVESPEAAEESALEKRRALKKQDRRAARCSVTVQCNPTPVVLKLIQKFYPKMYDLRLFPSLVDGLAQFETDQDATAATMSGTRNLHGCLLRFEPRMPSSSKNSPPFGNAVLRLSVKPALVQFLRAHLSSEGVEVSEISELSLKGFRLRLRSPAAAAALLERGQLELLGLQYGMQPVAVPEAEEGTPLRRKKRKRVADPEPSPEDGE